MSTQKRKQYPDKYDFDTHGEELTGTVVDRRIYEGKWGPVDIMEVRRDSDSTVFSVWCGRKALRDFLTDMDPRPGEHVRVAQVGREEFTKDGETRSMYLYDCQVHRSDIPALEPEHTDPAALIANEFGGTPVDSGPAAPSTDDDIPFAPSRV